LIGYLPVTDLVSGQVIFPNHLLAENFFPFLSAAPLNSL
jgi:hypothetical protein